MLRLLVTVSLLVGTLGDESLSAPTPERSLGGACVCSPTINCGGGSGGGGGGGGGGGVVDCPDDFTLKRSGATKICYKLVLHSRTSWYSAQNACHAMGPRVRLLVLDTREKYDMMEEVQQTMRSELGPWVGGKKEDRYGDFVWDEAGDATLGYDAWWSGEPSDSTPACINIYCGSSECGLWDASCSSGSRDYYCEKY